MKLQRLYSYVRQAMEDYDMIADNDRVAIGISGGKDSLTLLYALAGLRRFYPHPYELIAITVDLGYEGFDLSGAEALCKELSVEYHIVHTRIGRMVKDGECSLCARLRKGAFNEKARELGCNKIAYAHNMDDVVETMMLSLIYEGRFSTFWPVTRLSCDARRESTRENTKENTRENTKENTRENTKENIQGNTSWEMVVIRPLIYVPLSEVIGFRNKYALPVVTNPCPYDKITERAYVRQLLSDMNKHAPGVKMRMMTAITDGTIPEWRACKDMKEADHG